MCLVQCLIKAQLLFFCFKLFFTIAYIHTFQNVVQSDTYAKFLIKDLVHCFLPFKKLLVYFNG